MAAEIDRRAMLTIGGAAVALASGAGATLPATPAAGGVLFFEPTSPEARAQAAVERGQRLVALGGDPVRQWRDALGQHRGPVGGLTRWSDYLILRGLAEERGLRLTREERVPSAGGALIVRWQMV